VGRLPNQIGLHAWEGHINSFTEFTHERRRLHNAIDRMLGCEAVSWRRESKHTAYRQHRVSNPKGGNLQTKGDWCCRVGRSSHEPLAPMSDNGYYV